MGGAPPWLCDPALLVLPAVPALLALPAAPALFALPEVPTPPAPEAPPAARDGELGPMASLHPMANDTASAHGTSQRAKVLHFGLRGLSGPLLIEDTGI